MRKVYVDATVRLILRLDDATDPYKYLNEMTYSFWNTESNGGDIEDAVITDYEVVDSK